MDRPDIAVLSKSTTLKRRDLKIAKVWEMTKLQKSFIHINVSTLYSADTVTVDSHALLQGTYQAPDYQNKSLISVPTMFQLKENT
jgi:hypothetical protein